MAHHNLSFVHPSRTLDPSTVYASFTPLQCTAQPRCVLQPQTPCLRCGRMHSASQCKFRWAVCHSCGKCGHIKPMCHSAPSTVHHCHQENKTAPRPQRPNKVHYQHDNSHHVFQCTGSSMPPMHVELTVNSASLYIEVDTGASVSLISENTYGSTRVAKKRLPL